MFKLPEGLHNKYRFVTLSALRAEQLQAGARPRVGGSTRKVTIVAQEEVALGLVEAWDPNAPAPTADSEVGVASGEPAPPAVVLPH
jgi:DNA-directed RNA polymerase subunit K/omega